MKIIYLSGDAMVNLNKGNIEFKKSKRLDRWVAKLNVNKLNDFCQVNNLVILNNLLIDNSIDFKNEVWGEIEK